MVIGQNFEVMCDKFDVECMLVQFEIFERKHSLLNFNYCW